METFVGWLGNQLINESIDATRYSIEMNYRSKVSEVLEAYAKICLGFVSAGMKKLDFHVKQVFEEDPVRILVSSRLWDEGSWVAVLSYNKHHNCFFLTKGFYNKLRKTISVQGQPEKCVGENASELVAKLKNVMHELKDKPDRHTPQLKPVPLKRGRKK